MGKETDTARQTLTDRHIDRKLGSDNLALGWSNNATHGKLSVFII